MNTKTHNGWTPAVERVSRLPGQIEKIRPALVRDLDDATTLVVTFDDGTGALCVDFGLSPLVLASPDEPPTVSARLYRDDLIVAGRVMRVEEPFSTEIAAKYATIILAGFVDAKVDTADVAALSEDAS
jgi:hypothetical protein